MMAWDIEFVRGLAVAYRNATFLPSDVRDAIKAFLGVQVNDAPFTYMFVLKIVDSTTPSVISLI